MIAILVPVLKRTHRIQPLLESIDTNTTVPHRVVFIATTTDEPMLEALRGLDHITIPPQKVGDYGAKINAGYEATEEPYLFLAADDLAFHPGWDIAALAKMTDGIGVVGTNDLANRDVLAGDHSTHSLVSRRYADEQGTVDGPGRILSPVYPHEFVDNELVETAKARAAWAFAKDSIVEHLHPNVGKAPMDDLYAAQARRMREGGRIYQQRKRLWEPKPVADVAVIIATFGDDAWKQLAQERALASVKRQRMQPKETIVVHGETLADARNEGARQATGTFLLFLDADDELNPAYLRVVNPHLKGPWGLINPSTRFVLPDNRSKPPRLFKPGNLRNGNYLVIGTLVRSDMFWAAGGFDPRWRAYEDWALFWKIVDLGGRIKQVPQAVYLAHWRADGRNNTVDRKEELMAEIRAEHDEWLAMR